MNRVLRRIVSALGGRRSSLTRDQIRWAYRLFLDRDPESNAVVEEKIRSFATIRGLRWDFVVAPEFRTKNRDLSLITEPTVVLKELANGLRIFVDLADYMVGLPIVREEYESAELDLVRELLKPGQVGLDLGANVGLFTLTMASLVGSSGRVHAFEPWTRNADLLERSVAENAFADRVTVHRAAVGERAGRGQLVVLDGAVNSGGASLDTSGRGAPSSAHGLDDVAMIALDDLNLPHPVAFIKMDIEGAEPLAMRGATRLLRADGPTVLSEIHAPQMARVSGCRPEQYIAEMARAGYRCHLLEAGTVGRAISRVAADSILSVVFLAR